MGFDLFEIVLILAIALVVVGPDQMPAMVRAAAKVLREIRAASNEVMRELTEAVEDSKAPPARRLVKPTGELSPPPALNKGNAEDQSG